MPYKLHVAWAYATCGLIRCVSFRIQSRTGDENRGLWTKSIGIPRATLWQKRPETVMEVYSSREIRNDLVSLLLTKTKLRACHTDQPSALFKTMSIRSLINERVARCILVAGSVKSAGLRHVKFLSIPTRFSGSVRNSKPARHFLPGRLKLISLENLQPNAGSLSPGTKA